jgi:hypothetical protein
MHCCGSIDAVVSAQVMRIIGKYETCISIRFTLSRFAQSIQARSNVDTRPGATRSSTRNQPSSFRYLNEGICDSFP